MGLAYKNERGKSLEPVGIEPARNNRTNLLIYVRPVNKAATPRVSLHMIVGEAILFMLISLLVG